MDYASVSSSSQQHSTADTESDMMDDRNKREHISRLLMEKGKQSAAAFVSAECAKNNGKSPHLDALLDVLLNPSKEIDNSENIDWCRWLIAGGRVPNEFASIVRGYDNHAKCGLVWIPHVVAYRCRTCGISPCMSICRDCFKKGDHSTHDFNMFLSQAGGACDCGDTSVMKAEGFCCDHGISCSKNISAVPGDLMSVAVAIMPKILLRLLLHFRENGNSPNFASFDDYSFAYRQATKECDEYCSMLMELNNMGELMRGVTTKALINPEMYSELVEPPFPNSEFGRYLSSSKKKYEAAVSFPSPEPPDEYKHLPALSQTILHTTLLEEFIFWTFKFEFPQNIVCFLLNMLPDQDYKEHLTRTFVMHYSRIPGVLEMSSDPDTLSNRVVHMSVQLFSNESLALKMVEELNLLHVMIISLKLMMSKILIQNTLHDPDKNFHYVIDCAKRVMKQHCYWPLVSDFNNVLSHESVALVFLRDNDLLHMWFQFLSMLQGMNVNIRETGTHVEFEPSSYYAAFSCELEASAYPMWSILSHLKNPMHAPLAKKFLNFCTNYLQEWLEAIDIDIEKPIIPKKEKMHASFHFPLHRYYAAFISQAIKNMDMQLEDIIVLPDLIILLMMHPLRVQTFFHEILSGIWVRNGLQIKGQAMTYIQANFCNCMVDMDLFFLQICATQLPGHIFLTIAVDAFGVKEWLGMCPLTSPQEMEQDSMLEGLLAFLATLITSRTNLGNDEPTQCLIEISSLLAIGDKTHSQLLELMPERSGNAHTRNFEKFLKELSTYRPPPLGSENLEQGLFIPVSDVWEEHYDPLHVLLRAVHRRDFQNSMDRFTNYVKQEKKMPKSGSLWPPYRLPGRVGKGYSDPGFILNSRMMHSALLGIFYRAVHSHSVSEHMLGLAVFLLEMAVEFHHKSLKDPILACGVWNDEANHRNPPELLKCYPSDCLSENLRMTVSRISLLASEPNASPANYSTTTFDSDLEWDASESNTLPMLEGDYSNVLVLPSVAGPLEVAIPQNLSVVRDHSNVNYASNQEARINEDSSVSRTLVLSDTVQTVVEYHPQHQDEIPIVQPHLTLPPIQLPESGMEVAIRRDLEITTGETSRNNTEEMFSATANNSGMILPFQRVQPVAVPNRNMDVVPSNQSTNPRRLCNSSKKRPIDSMSSSVPDTIFINESIISLLLKLHSQLSGALDSFSIEEFRSSQNDNTDMDVDLSATAGPSNRSTLHQQHTARESRIGDGPFFIGNLLRKIAKLDDKCASNINDIRQQLWPNQREKQAEQRMKEEREKEERSKKAKERQHKLMQEFANKQKQFMAMASEQMECGDDEDEEIEQPREKEYVCIICNRTSPSTDSNPIGLVVLVESSGVIGHRRKSSERFLLSLCDEDCLKPERHVRLATEFNRRTELLGLKFGEDSWYLSNNLAYESGVHVQSCGHHVHLACHDAYLNSLYTSQRPQNLNVERGEFLCPVCRQLSNSVLPLSPQLDRPTPVIRLPAPPYETLVSELTTLIKENERPPTSTKLSEAMGRAMEDMTNSTHRKAKRVLPTFRSLFLFVTSIARTNLEAEIIQRGGSLCTNNLIRYKPKRDCIVPLLHVLSVHVRVLVEWPLWRSWASLCGLKINDNAPVPSHCREFIPSLLADPIALLLKFILLAPLHLDQVFFTCIVKSMYNLLYYQIVMQLCTTLTEMECSEIIVKFSSNVNDGGVVNLGAAMALVLNNTNCCRHLRRECVNDDEEGASFATASCSSPSISNNYVNMQSMELQMQKLCLPFLRVAALLRHHLYHQELPEVTTAQLEFVRLMYFLELVTESMDWDAFNAAKGLCFISGTEVPLPKFWCDHLMDICPPTAIVRELVMNQHIAWQQPRLLGLPQEYERLFSYYHEKSCKKCDSVPKESSICLLCGTIVCLKQRCCIEDECCEAVRHTIQCGGGTGIFLVVTSTYIIVIRGRRACLWGSLYLDDFDEEDRDLKRGKPLYLSQDRFSLLESQWLSHRFAHTKHTWVFHRDSL